MNISCRDWKECVRNSYWWPCRHAQWYCKHVWKPASLTSVTIVTLVQPQISSFFCNKVVCRCRLANHFNFHTTNKNICIALNSIRHYRSVNLQSLILHVVASELIFQIWCRQCTHSHGASKVNNVSILQVKFFIKLSSYGDLQLMEGERKREK